MGYGVPGFLIKAQSSQDGFLSLKYTHGIVGELFFSAPNLQNLPDSEF